MQTKTLLALSVVTCLASAAINASPALAADVETLRAAKRAATATFLDQKQPQEARLAAVKDMGFPDDETLPSLLRIARDTKESDAVRLVAFKFLHYGLVYLSAALKVLDDPKDGGADLDANLIQDISRRTTFRLPEEDEQRIFRSFRKLLSDKRDLVRLYAYRALVWNHDTVALNTLTESLRRGTGVPVPLAEAIDLLYQDGAQNYIGVLRPYLANKDVHVQARAARALAVDPESRRRIVEFANDAATPEEVRLDALSALAREDKDFASYAIPIVANTKENPGIRYLAMREFVGRMNYKNVPAEDQIRFAQVVERVLGEQNLLATEKGLKTSRAAQELLPYLKKSFPAIQSFYANR